MLITSFSFFVFNSLIYMFRYHPVGGANPFEEARIAKVDYGVTVTPASVTVDKLQMKQGVTGYSTPASVSVMAQPGTSRVTCSSRGPKYTVEYVQPGSSPEMSDPNDETYEPPG